MVMVNGYYDNETLYQMYKKNLTSAFFSSCECCLKLLVIQIVRMTYSRDYMYSGSWGKKVVPYLLAKVCKGHNGYALILLEMDW